MSLEIIDVQPAPELEFVETPTTVQTNNPETTTIISPEKPKKRPEKPLRWKPKTKHPKFDFEGRIFLPNYCQKCERFISEYLCLDCFGVECQFCFQLFETEEAKIKHQNDKKTACYRIIKGKEKLRKDRENEEKRKIENEAKNKRLEEKQAEKEAKQAEKEAKKAELLAEKAEKLAEKQKQAEIKRVEMEAERQKKLEEKERKKELQKKRKEQIMEKVKDRQMSGVEGKIVEEDSGDLVAKKNFTEGVEKKSFFFSKTKLTRIKIPVTKVLFLA